jgi:predicted alpha/beta-fold hydrolase
MARLVGHLWTIVGRVRRGSGPQVGGESWATLLADPVVGEVRLTGRLHRLGGDAASDDSGGTLLVLVHGLGGSIDSAYLRETTARLIARRERGWPGGPDAVLRLNVRGADRSGEDLFHAGLAEDLHAALAEPSLAAYERVVVLGFSLGGHLALRYATEAGDRRLRAVAALCSPLALDPAAAAIDGPGAGVYRRYLLRHLCEIYAAVAARRPLPEPVERLREVRTIRAFDELAVAPRFGFAGAADYYARASVAPRLSALRVPGLLVLAKDDPMVAAEAVRPALAEAPAELLVRWLDRGGHVAFPRGEDLRLGVPTSPGGSLELQVIDWLLAEAVAGG